MINCNFVCSREKLKRFYRCSMLMKPVCVELAYFIGLSVLGYLGLKLGEAGSGASRPSNLDLFFTSVSAATVASMSTVEMEVFSNTQLIIITVLMLLGGEVFVSMLALRLQSSIQQLSKRTADDPRLQQVELGVKDKKPLPLQPKGGESFNNDVSFEGQNVLNMRSKCRKSLGYVVLGYLLVVHVAGAASVWTYVRVVPSARRVLEAKSISFLTFSVMVVVSTFANAGFLPTNENMAIFLPNSGLLLLVAPLGLLGNTLYPVSLRLLLSALPRISRRPEFRHILTHCRELGYPHLLPPLRSAMLAATALGFLAVQLLLLCAMEWNSRALALTSLTRYQKLVACFFQAINSRHAGESVFDLSAISSAVLVLFVLMMYLPPYATFLPCKDEEEIMIREQLGKKKEKQARNGLAERLLPPQLACLVVFIILVCITERHKLRDDPLNFNLLSITVEVISAFGNVGFSTCYSCKRQLKQPKGGCRDTWAGFVGRWSTMGKIILILVMFFGRLKKYTFKVGKAWHISDH